MMYGKIFDIDNGECICYEVSHLAALAYASLIYHSDEIGEDAPIIKSVQVALNLDCKTKAVPLIEELVNANLIEVYKKKFPIAELEGGCCVMGNVLCAKILHYQQPDNHQRLNPVTWNLLREKVFKRDNYVCGYCLNRGGELECDHIIPIAKGGTNELGNLVTACKKCNRQKRDRIIKEISA